MNKLQISKLLSAVETYYKTAQVKDPQSAENLVNSRIQTINSINPKQWTLDQVREQANEQQLAAFRDLQQKLITPEQYAQVVGATEAKVKSAETPTPATSAKATPAKPQGKQPTEEQRWGTKDQQTMIADVQKFLMNIVGKEAFGPYGADGKWGPKSQAALRTWLTHQGKKGSGYLDMDALTELSKHIPSVRKYYTESFKQDPILGF